MKAILFTLLFTFASAIAQDYRAHPVIGWDSLSASIRYPEILRRAGVEGAANVIAKFDSTGAIDTILVTANHEVFRHSIEYTLRSTKWHPGMYRGKATPSAAFFNVHFYINNDVRRISVETGPAVIMRSH